MTTLMAAIPEALLTGLKDNAAKVANKKLDVSARKNARKEALRVIRRLMAVFEGFKPMDHFRDQPFHAGSKQISG